MRRRTTGRCRPRSIGAERYGLADDQAELGRAGQDLNLGVRIELAAQVAKVTAHGHVADPHPGRDVPIVESSRQLPEDLALALGEQVASRELANCALASANSPLRPTKLVSCSGTRPRSFRVVASLPT